MSRRRPGPATALLICLVVVTGCGGGTETLSRADLADQQKTTDDVARLVVSTLQDRLDAKPPSPDSLGLGLLAGCDGGDADQASYFVDTFVTYAVQDPKKATAEVAAALRSAGLSTTVDPKTSQISSSRDGVTIDLTTQDKNGGSAGQNIFVSSGCLTIGQARIRSFNQDPSPVTS